MGEFADTIIRGIILGLSITAPVGPTNIEIIRRGSKDSAWSAASFCVGVMVALVLYLVLVACGLTVLVDSVLFKTSLTAFGVLVLAYLAYNSITDFFQGGQKVDLDEPTSNNRHFVPGILLTISNPAILLLWTGIMGADLAANQASITQGLTLSLGILLGVAIFFITLVLLIHFGRTYIKQQYMRYVSLIAGIVLLFFCLKFAYGLMEQLL